MIEPPPVRTLLCTSGGAHGAIVLRRLLASRRVKVVGVIQSTRVLSSRYGLVQGAWAQWRRCGLRYALYLACAAAGGIASQARGNDVPVHRTRDLNSPQGLSFLERTAPDLLVSAFFNQRIGPALAGWPRGGAVNLHPSLLPQLRGVDPVFYAMLRESACIGVTLHRIAPQLDAGPIVAQRAMEIVPGESVLRATARMFAQGAALLLDSLDAILAGEPGSPQAGPASYDSWPQPRHVAELRRKGVRLLTGRDLLDLARGRLVCAF